MNKLRLVAMVLMLLTNTSFAADKVLVVLSGVDYVELKNQKKHPTGYYLSELYVPLKHLLAQGYEIDFANPTGTKAVMDVTSVKDIYFSSPEEKEEALSFVRNNAKFSSPLKLSSLSEESLYDYIGIFVPGGHAPMQDLYKDKELGRILRHFHKNKKPTALICHAPVALLSAKENDKWIYKGYKMTAFSKAEEEIVESSVLNGEVLFYITDELEKAGAILSYAKEPFKSHAVKDRELITGQNPFSDMAFINLFTDALIEFKLKNKDLLSLYDDLGESIQSDKAIEVLRDRHFWEEGYVTLFIGKKKENYPRERFLPRLRDHILLVADKLSNKGLAGYIIYQYDHYEVALQSWKSKEAMEAALKTPSGALIRSDANEFLDFVHFSASQITPLETLKLYLDNIFFTTSISDFLKENYPQYLVDSRWNNTKELEVEVELNWQHEENILFIYEGDDRPTLTSAIFETKTRLFFSKIPNGYIFHKKDSFFETLNAELWP
jgi:putative intracellular protease/amidase